MAIREADKLVINVRPVHIVPRTGGLTLKLPSFDWKTADKYGELCNLK